MADKKQYSVIYVEFDDQEDYSNAVDYLVSADTPFTEYIATSALEVETLGDQDLITLLERDFNARLNIRESTEL